MSVLVSRLDRASAAHRANRSAKLRLLEDFSAQFAQSRAGGCKRHVLATGAWHRAVALHSGEVKGTDGFGVFRM